MTIQDMIKYWQEKIPLTEEGIREAEDTEDWQTAEGLAMVVMQQTAILNDLESLRLYWLTQAASRPDRADVIRAVCGTNRDIFGETAVLWTA